MVTASLSGQLQPETTTVEMWLAHQGGFLNQICQVMRLAVCEVGISGVLDLIPGPSLAEFTIEQDPFDQSKTLKGTWRDGQGMPQGEIQLRENGTVYAEINVIRAHPKDSHWFVEAVTAWGTPDTLKTELRLLPAV